MSGPLVVLAAGCGLLVFAVGATLISVQSVVETGRVEGWVAVVASAVAIGLAVLGAPTGETAGMRLALASVISLAIEAVALGAGVMLKASKTEA